MKIPSLFPKSHNTRGFAICFGVALLVLFLFTLGWLDALELKTIDFRFRWRGSRPVDRSIVLIEIDEKSQDKFGRWPWPRRVHADLINILGHAGAKVVVFDTLFPEVDNTDNESDRALVRSVQGKDNIVMAFHFRGEMRDQLFASDALLPYSPLSEEVFIGFANNFPDSDGVSRRATLYLIDGETVYPHLSVAGFARTQGKTVDEIFGELPVVLSKSPELAENKLLINWAHDREHPMGSPYETYSYHDVYSRRVNPEIFRDKIVFIGATAAGLGDIKSTPYSEQQPGVMVHTNVVDNLLHGNYLHEIATYYTMIYVLVLGVFLGFFLPRLSTWHRLLVFAVTLIGGVYGAHWLFSFQDYVLHMVPPLLAGVGGYGGLLFYQVVVEEREKRKIKGSFRQYLSPKIIDIITRDPAKLKLGGEERRVTIFFLDIAGFTTMSEALHPTQLVEVMNECLTTFSHIILQHDGLINKYIGDCIMAFWNAPADQPKHATQACQTALDCIKALPEINKRFQEKGLPAIDCRIGINTGVVVVGNMGSHERFDYTVMGDAVNLASRLEGANKQYNSKIMVADTTFDLAKEDIEARDLDLIRVKGKKEPRKVFEILCPKGQMSHQVEKGRHLYHEALHDYRQKNFKEAIAKFKQVFDYLPGDHLTKVYIDRAETYLKTPPPSDWDGVFELKTK